MEENTVVPDNSVTDSDIGGSDSEFDVETASSDLAGDLFPESGKQHDESTDFNDEIVDENVPVETDGNEVSEQAPPVVESSAPKTWPKEMHEHWSKMPKEAQDYWNVREKQMLDGLDQYKEHAAYGKQMKDAITPYMALIQAQGIDATTAVKSMLNAHYKLSVSAPSQKTEYFQKLAKQYGVDLGAVPHGEGQQVNQPDPIVRQLQDELHNLKQVINSGTEQQLNAERDRISKEVNSFATDAAHPYFDDIADDIIVMLKSGVSLQDAYEKAVWANPVTRAKEIARLQQEQAEDLRKKSQEKAESAKKATSVNIRNRDTRRTPTETKRATMRGLDDALRESMREIKSQTQ